MGELINKLRTVDDLTYNQCVQHIGLTMELTMSISTARRMHLEYLADIEEEEVKQKFIPWYIKVWNKLHNLRFN